MTDPWIPSTKNPLMLADIAAPWILWVWLIIPCCFQGEREKTCFQGELHNLPNPF